MSTKWKKGQSGNPGGRKKLPSEFKELAREKSIECLREVLDIAQNKRVHVNTRLKACELIMAYGVGKPNQSIELSGSIQMPDELINRPQRIDRTEWLMEYQTILPPEEELN